MTPCSRLSIQASRLLALLLLQVAGVLVCHRATHVQAAGCSSRASGSRRLHQDETGTVAEIRVADFSSIPDDPAAEDVCCLEETQLQTTVDVSDTTADHESALYGAHTVGPYQVDQLAAAIFAELVRLPRVRDRHDDHHQDHRSAESNIFTDACHSVRPSIKTFAGSLGIRLQSSRRQGYPSMTKISIGCLHMY